MKALLAALLMWSGGAATAGDRVEDTVSAWSVWAEKHNVPSTVLAIVQDRALVRVAAKGASEIAPAPLASLSKAVTGACVRVLVDAGLAGYGDEVSQYLSDAPAGVTIAQLLTHSAGFEPDGTQTAMLGWLNDPVDRHREVTAAVFARGSLGERTHSYNNENYAVLGTLIEAITGENYAAACAARVLNGLNSAERSEQYGAYLAWGGWAMSAADYAMFFDRTFGGGYDFSALPTAPLGNGAVYGLGAMHVEARGAVFSWHAGLLCFGPTDGDGAYALRSSAVHTVVVTFQGCLSEGAFEDLDAALLTAILG